MLKNYSPTTTIEYFGYDSVPNHSHLGELVDLCVFRKPTTGGGIVEKSPLILFHYSPTKEKDAINDKLNVYTKYIQNHVTRHSNTHTQGV